MTRRSRRAAEAASTRTELPTGDAPLRSRRARRAAEHGERVDGVMPARSAMQNRLPSVPAPANPAATAQQPSQQPAPQHSPAPALPIPAIEQRAVPLKPHAHHHDKHAQAVSARDRPKRRRKAAATASFASIGLVMSVLFAFPAHAVPGALPDGTNAAEVDGHGRTAAQIIAVSRAVMHEGVHRDSSIASALSGIIASQDGAPEASATAAITSALQSGGPRQTIVETALAYLGDPYALGGSDHSGIDCSGLVMVAYASVGITLKHLVSSQDAAGVEIPASEAKPGDLVVFDDNEHIGIYLGGNMLIQAPEAGRPVNVEEVWSGVSHHFTRILPAGA